MKVLFVSGTLPPEGTATASIIGNIMRDMAERGVDVSGLTFKNSMSDDRVSYWKSDISIFHANYVREYGVKCCDIFDYLFKVKRKLYDVTHKKKIYPYRELAVNALVAMLKIMNAKDNYDIIVSVAAFYDAVEAVNRYRSLAGETEKVKFVFYQLDPLQENLAFKGIETEWLEAYERSIISNFDFVFTTREIYEMKAEKKWTLKNVIAMNYPCVDRRLSKRNSSIKKEEKEIRCIYAGQLNNKIRDATNTLKILSAMSNSNISFYFIGNGQEELLREYSNGLLNGRLHIMGSMSAKECENWILSADILLIIGNNVTNQVPSKIFSYMSYGLPIIATCKSPNCPARKYLKEVPNALIIDETDENICELAKQIEKYIFEHSGSRLTWNQIEKYADKYTPEKVTNKMLEVFKQI